MKKFILAIALAGSQMLWAQNPKDSLSQKLSQIFAQIDPGLVASGRIYDKGFALTNPGPLSPKGGTVSEISVKFKPAQF